MWKVITHFLWKVFVLPPPTWEATRKPVHQQMKQQYFFVKNYPLI